MLTSVTSIYKVKFLGHVIDHVGMHSKVCAIQQLKARTNVTDFRRFLGLVTYISKFTSNLSQKVKPLRDHQVRRISGFGALLSGQLSSRLSKNSVIALFQIPVEIS